MTDNRVTKIKKRNGIVVDFNLKKIVKAIEKAFIACNSSNIEGAYSVAQDAKIQLDEKFDGRTIPTVEETQDIVEKSLIINGYADEAKMYILYRSLRNKARKTKRTMINVKKTVHAYLKKKDWEVKENSNTDYSFSGLMLYTSGQIIKNYMLTEVYPDHIVKAYEDGHIHIHDLGNGIIGYCSGWSIEKLLMKGFTDVPNKSESLPAKHLDVVVSQMVNFMGVAQMEFAGAIAFSSVDVYLAPFVKKDNLSYDQTKQNMQKLIFGLNVPSRWGSSTPFSNLTFDLTVPDDLRDRKAIVGGKEQTFTYGECQKEIDMINAAFLEIMEGGDAKGRIFSLHPDEKVIIRNKQTKKIKIDKIANIIDPEICNEGNKNVKDLKLEAMSINFNTFKTTFKPITHFIKHEERGTCVMIETILGNTICVTKGHSLFIFKENGTIKPFRVSNLTNEDFIVTTKKLNIRNKLSKEFYYTIERVKGDRYIFKKTIKLDNDFAWLLGFFAGNGSMMFKSSEQTRDNVRGFELSSLQENVQNEIVAKLHAIFPGLRYYKRHKGITISSRAIAKLFFDALEGAHKSVDVYVPNKILTSIYYDSYIKGYFDADGTKKGNTYIVRTISKRMSETLPIIFMYKGYKCHKNVYTYNNRKPIYQLTFTKNELKKNCFPLWKYIRDNIIKKNGWEVKEYENYKRKNLSIGKIRELYCLLKERSNQRIYDPIIEKVLSGDIFLERIKTIKEYDYNGFVYDFSVSGSEAFVGTNGIVFHNTFPIPTYNLTKDFNWNSEVSNKLFKVTAKYGLPYFQNYINSGLDPKSVRAMCCRLNINQNELLKRPGNMWAAGDSTGAVGVCTVNLNRIAYEASLKKDIQKRRENFFERIAYYMNLAKISLEIKRELISKNLREGLMPYTKVYLGSFNNYFSVVGLCGMHEACINLLKKGLETEEGKNFAIETLKFMREKLKEFQEETGNLYNLEATPAESTSYRFAIKDKKMYPDIFTSGTEKVPFLTNSTQLPVDATTNLWEAIEHQNAIQPLYTGGTIFHCFLGERIIDSEACKSLVRKIAENTKLPYFSITPTFSVCPEHGYLSGEFFNCPTCNKDCEVYSRIVGYFRPVSNWNDGKRQEYHERKTFEMDEKSIVTEHTETHEKAKFKKVILVDDIVNKIHEKLLSIPREILLFKTSNCPKCVGVEKRFERANGRANGDISIRIINASTQEGMELAKRYDIKTVPTIVLIEEEIELKRYCDPEEMTNEFIESILV